MMRAIDRTFAVLLLLGGAGHSVGSFLAYRANQMELLWSLSASLFVFLLGAVNFLRAGRPNDGALGWICLLGGLAWIVACLRFGQLAGNLLDMHAVIFIVFSLGLCAFSLMTIRSASSGTP